MGHPASEANDSSRVPEEIDSISPVSESEPPSQVNSEGEYDKFRQHLLVTTLVTSLAICCTIVWFFPVNVVVNYAVGSLVGIVYLHMLGRGVARVGSASRSTGAPARLGLFALLIIVATQVKSLEVLPIFLGFMTFKAALFIYAFQTLVPSRKSKAP